MKRNNLLTSLCAAILLASSPALADDLTATIDKVTYTYDAKTRTATITSANNVENFKPYEVPSTVTIDDVEYTVTKIASSAFQAKLMSSVVIPETIEEIGESAFNACSFLATVENNSKVTTIAKQTFYNCIRLKTVNIPETVTSIGEYAFCSCDSLAPVTISESVTTIGNGAFMACRPNLTSVTIPGSVKEIGDNAFSGCWQLTDVYISEGVERIGKEAFYASNSLERVYLPSTLTFVGAYAFAQCGWIDHHITVTIAATTPPACDSDEKNAIFNFSGYIEAFYVPVGSKAAYESSNPWKFYSIYTDDGFTEDPTLPTSLKKVDVKAFGGAKVYNLSGREVGSLQSAPKGVYVVRRADGSSRLVRR